MTMPTAIENRTRARLSIYGAVQGVGFRPWIYRLATELGLVGWVCNTGQGVVLEIEGERPKIEQFLFRVEPERPAHSFIQSLETVWLPPVGFDGFEIRSSASNGDKTALVMPDIATCPDCLCELFDPANRRFGYPFINCTHCGPRFSILEKLPYDRANTSMRGFDLCPECRSEYEDPVDRRFHAQPNACPVCGPHLALWNGGGDVMASRDEALEQAASAIESGGIVAIKGLGGFHLVCDARNQQAVQRLRSSKNREEKPFAVMEPTLEEARRECAISALEERLLCASEAPIVLLRRLENGASIIAESVAPGNPFLGLMLPYAPLHHLLMRRLGFPIVATSGNRSGEPICIDEREALVRLGGIADLFLVHNRPILRPVDDSVARVLAGREMILRRARGYAPLPLHLPESAPCVLATGAHLKSAVALSSGRNLFVSQHLGDLETASAFAGFQKTTADLQALFYGQPAVIACDLHPRYLSTSAAESVATQTSAPLLRIQHHYAHVLSCMAENEIEPPVLGVAWDGTGYGTDGSIWGGEFLQVDAEGFRRVAHLRTFSLPGGDAAAREPRRCALGLLYEMLGAEAFEKTDLPTLRSFSTSELRPLRSALERKVNTPRTSSMGRLFDAVVSLAGLRQTANFEGQAAMEWEWQAERSAYVPDSPYSFHPVTAAFEIDRDNNAVIPNEREGSHERFDGRHCKQNVETLAGSLALARDDKHDGGCHLSPGAGMLKHEATEPMVLNWEPMIREMIADIRANVPVSEISRRFHETLVEMIIAVARRINLAHVALTGGCFQNELLATRAIERLSCEGFTPVWHQRIPPNDGGIAVGQAVGAIREIRKTFNR